MSTSFMSSLRSVVGRRAEKRYAPGEVPASVQAARRDYAAVDVALLGRYYERIADHTVAISRQVIYVVTGESPDGEDWPRF